MAPSRWNIRKTAKLVPIEWPDSTLIRLAIFPSACTSLKAIQEINTYWFGVLSENIADQ